jgi:transposase
LRTIAEGCTDASVLSSKVTTKIKRKEEARKALTNCLTTEHIFLIQELMEQFDHLEARIKNAESELRDKIEPYKDIVAALDEIPGIDEILAMGIIAEATTDMSNFPNERNFAAWAGVAAGNNESAGKKKIKMSKRQPAPQKTADSSCTECKTQTQIVLPRKV